jgi:hypothetical protein
MLLAKGKMSLESQLSTSQDAAIGDLFAAASDCNLVDLAADQHFAMADGISPTRATLFKRQKPISSRF